MIWLLDNGHGGIKEGEYLTTSPHKKSPQLPDGTILYEGDWNRKVVKSIIEQSKNLKLKIINLTPELEDINLDERAKRANKYKNAFVLSIHMNGTDEFFQTEKRGITTFYYRHNEGRKYAWIFQDQISEIIPNRGIFEKAFRLPLKSTNPCLLLECGFMNNIKDVEYLRTELGIKKLALYIVLAMKEVEKLINK
jgi:N-acetylmuramoyl-L-alanine amidase